MAVTSLYPDLGNRWLTSVGAAKPGDEVTLSFSNSITGGEFTTFRLGDVQGVNRYGESLFDLDMAEINVFGRWYVSRDVHAAFKGQWGEFTFDGRDFKRTGFGHWRLLDGAK